ncbi:hypothetical protein KSS87_004711, partial [Heliosperma pusillum]
LTPLDQSSTSAAPALCSVQSASPVDGSTLFSDFSSFPQISKDAIENVDAPVKLPLST